MSLEKDDTIDDLLIGASFEYVINGTAMIINKSKTIWFILLFRLKYLNINLKKINKEENKYKYHFFLFCPKKTTNSIKILSFN